MGLLGREIKEEGMQEERKHEGSKQDSGVNKGGDTKEQLFSQSSNVHSPFWCLRGLTCT